MDLNIKGIIHLDFRKFKTIEELIDFLSVGDNFDNLAKIQFNETTNIISYREVFKQWDEIWILSGYLVARRKKGSDQIMINPDLSRFIIEKSFNYVYEHNREQKKDFISNLSVDDILDKINQIGFENLTDEEKKFLKDNT
jgi:hypothetical protein